LWHAQRQKSDATLFTPLLPRSSYDVAVNCGLLESESHPPPQQASSLAHRRRCPGVGKWRRCRELPCQVLGGRFASLLSSTSRPGLRRVSGSTTSHGLTPHLSTLTACHQRQPSSSKQVLLVSPCGFRFRSLLRIPINWQPPPHPPPIPVLLIFNFILQSSFPDCIS
jgi:hypothetical protein